MPHKIRFSHARGCKLVLAIIAVFANSASPSCGQATQLVRWEIQATVTNLVDPGGIFPDVRLGDPVRGTLQYDAAMLIPNPFFSQAPILHTYTNHPWLHAASMVIENTRTGGELRFTPNEESEGYTGIDVANDLEVEGDATDGLFATQPVVAPPGFAGDAPAVFVVLGGPATTIPDLSLPDKLSLDDWPEAAFVFYDRLLSDESGTLIEAEIYSLTPVAVAPGDFNADGRVDGDDLAIWQDQFGGDYYAYGDADADGDADGADFLAWQRQLGAPAQLISAPEPRGLALAGMALAAVLLVLRRPRWRIFSQVVGDVRPKRRLQYSPL